MYFVASYPEAHKIALSGKSMDSTWVDTSLELNISHSSISHQTSKEKCGGSLCDLENKAADKQEERVVEELNRISTENKKLNEMLSIMYENYCAMQSQLRDLMSKNSKMELDELSKKRKAADIENFNVLRTSPHECSFTNFKETCKTPSNGSNKRTKISRVHVPIDASDSILVVKDGYQWRKYGQKVTRDNPCPRAYFRCSFAPSCPVKKKVQRSAEDPSVLVATYEGEHNHQPLNSPVSQTSTGTTQYGSTSLRPAPTTTTLSANQIGDSDGDCSFKREPNGQEIQELLVQQMATSLTRDPNFTAALAAAISGTMLHHTH